MYSKKNIINREISWLSFNERVLQEASDPSVPLIQRMRFLGIFSNNLDEFFRVRVATIHRIANLGRDHELLGHIKADDLLEEIQKIVLEQQEKHQEIYAKLLKELEKYNIYVINEKQVDTEQGLFIEKYFRDTVNPSIVPIMVHYSNKFPELDDNLLYFAIKLSSTGLPKKPTYSLIELNPEFVPRFLVLPPRKNKKYIIIIDDVIRYCLNNIFAGFGYDKIEAYTIKVTRDAEFDLDDDMSKSYIEKMSIGLKNRKKGDAVRFVYDSEIPKDFLSYLKKRLKIEEYDSIIPGGRYHNFKDFINFPSIVASNKLENIPTPPLQCKLFKPFKSMLEVIRNRDVILHYPYHTFNHFIDFLREAAIDKDVTSIGITIYRLAGKSSVINTLINAVRNGKKVVAVIELQARFDERANIRWANYLVEGGVKVIHGVPGLKVHGKLALVSRRENHRLVNYAYVGTGNFHEGTAKIYCDEGLFTSDRRISDEVAKVFEFFSCNYKRFNYKHLILSPFDTRDFFMILINNEIEIARKHKSALIYLKLNSLLDEKLINKLYEASQGGVKVKLIVRGVCSLVAGVPGLSDNIEAISIVDKYLEHARIMIFQNQGNELCFISSADWMPRNLDNRVEVTCPIYDPKIINELKTMIKIQLEDNIKARLHTEDMSNKYKRNRKKSKVRAQVQYYEWLKKENE